ncbi:LysE family transporter [Xylanimonas sp. McL0601]|uniref:LysE family transporter n=1 Tax=Xylanimonas sp. McL0601 TaxID=3414739 RepID=UPI003CEC57DB
MTAASTTGLATGLAAELAAAVPADLPAALLAGVAAGYAIALPVGAVATYLIGLAARSPWRVAAAGALGMATVDGAYALLAALGGAAVTRWIGPVATPLRVVAAAVLVVVAMRSAVRAWQAWRAHAAGAAPVYAGARERTALRTWAHLVAVTAVNPATVLFFAVVVAGRSLPDGGGTGHVPVAVAFAVGAFVASASWQLVLAGAGTALGRALAGPRGRLATALASSVVMVALAVVMLAG